MKALIVDDAMLARIIIRNILTETGFDEFWEAPNGEEAIKLYDQVHPDLVTMDITMPGMGGANAIKAIMALDSSARIVAVSALGEKEIITEAIRAGARELIVKPCENEKMRRIISMVMSR